MNCRKGHVQWPRRKGAPSQQREGWGGGLGGRLFFCAPRPVELTALAGSSSNIQTGWEGGASRPPEQQRTGRARCSADWESRPAVARRSRVWVLEEARLRLGRHACDLPSLLCRLRGDGMPACQGAGACSSAGCAGRCCAGRGRRCLAGGHRLCWQGQRRRSPVACLLAAW